MDFDELITLAYIKLQVAISSDDKFVFFSRCETCDRHLGTFFDTKDLEKRIIEHSEFHECERWQGK